MITTVLVEAVMLCGSGLLAAETSEEAFAKAMRTIVANILRVVPFHLIVMALKCFLIFPQPVSFLADPSTNSNETIAATARSRGETFSMRNQHDFPDWRHRGHRPMDAGETAGPL